MAKPHTTLSVRTNIVLICIWAAVLFAFLFVISPRTPLAMGIVGAALGAIGGALQHLSFGQALSTFNDTDSALGVRNAFKSTPWGKRYIAFLYLSKGILFVLALWFCIRAIPNVLFGYLTGYFALMLVREVVTLPDTFRLARLIGPKS
jgi:hypothetical protein